MNDLHHCPSCKAPHGPGEALCWMCGYKFWSGTPAPEKPARPAASPLPPIEERKPAPRPSPKPRPAAPPSASAAGAVDWWTQPTLIASFVLLLTGLATNSATGTSAGTALLWFSLVPALFVTALAGFREPKKDPETGLEKLQWIVTKLASVLAILILAGAAIAIALVAACFGIVAVVSH